MKTHNIEVLLQPLKGDCWLFQVLWMNEKRRELKEFRASNGWRVNCGCGNLYPLTKVVELMGTEDAFSKPMVIPKSNVTFAEIEQALKEWSVWADKQIHKLNVGDIVTVPDGSWSLGIVNNKLEKTCGVDFKGMKFVVIATDLKLPAAQDMISEEYNDTIISAIGVNKIVFIQGQLLSPIVDKRIGENVESDNPHIIKV